jgi:hypothetical protein
MLNGVYLQEDLDFLLVAHKHGDSKVELRRAPQSGDQLVVLRVPTTRPVGTAKPKLDDDVPPYERLPKRVKDNIAPEQWPEAEHEVVHTSGPIPETGQYINRRAW